MLYSPFCLLIFNLLQCLCQLIGTGGWAEAAFDALHALDGVINFHASYQACNALCISGTAAGKYYRFDYIPFYLNVDGLGANPMRFICHTTHSFVKK